jgi:hypothetical protein
VVHFLYSQIPFSDLLVCTSQKCQDAHIQLLLDVVK